MSLQSTPPRYSPDQTQTAALEWRHLHFQPVDWSKSMSHTYDCGKPKEEVVVEGFVVDVVCNRVVLGIWQWQHRVMAMVPAP